MKMLLARRPSPALVISLIALFVAMSGTGYAVSKIGTRQLKRAAVTSSKIKKNAVTSSKIKKNAVTKTKIKKDAVTGDKILESSLGKVPDADKLDGLDSAAYEKSSKFTRIASASLVNNETREIAKVGPFTLTAKCLINSGGLDVANILISTTQENGAFEGDDDTPDLDPGTPEANRELIGDSTPTGTPGIDHETDGFAIAADGTQFNIEGWVGENLFGQAGRCQYGGILFIV